jgi:hypothetical protein
MGRVRVPSAPGAGEGAIPAVARTYYPKCAVGRSALPVRALKHSGPGNLRIRPRDDGVHGALAAEPAGVHVYQRVVS